MTSPPSLTLSYQTADDRRSHITTSSERTCRRNGEDEGAGRYEFGVGLECGPDIVRNVEWINEYRRAEVAEHENGEAQGRGISQADWDTPSPY